MLEIQNLSHTYANGTVALDDGWTAVTRDRSLSAQFEHSIGITDAGCEIFTKSPGGLDRPYH